LAVLTGQPPATLQALLAPLAPLPIAAADSATGVPTQTLRRRPDVRAAEQRVSAAMAGLSQAQAARWPQVGLSGSLGLSALSLGQAAALVRAIAGQVSLPMVDGGAIAAQIRAQQAVLDQARTAWQAVVLLALQDVEDARAALRGDRTQWLRLQAAAQAATQAAQLARQRYVGGLVDYQTVLETQRTRLATLDGVAAAQAAVASD
jgi:multidrug efflux system outer membrane protein